jgi:hypothetical protein
MVAKNIFHAIEELQRYDLLPMIAPVQQYF